MWFFFGVFEGASKKKGRRKLIFYLESWGPIRKNILRLEEGFKTKSQKVRFQKWSDKASKIHFINANWSLELSVHKKREGCVVHHWNPWWNKIIKIDFKIHENRKIWTPSLFCDFFQRVCKDFNSCSSNSRLFQDWFFQEFLTSQFFH